MLLLARVDETTSKAAAGHSVDLDAVARATAGSFVLPAARAGFDLAYEGGVPVGCRGDPVLLREMISNLIDNAIRHAKAGASIVVAVRTDGDTAILSVEDDGCGIPAELRTAVMERYSTTAPRPGGVGGLGLAIVNEIAALFEGSVRLASGARERGTRVEVRLRAAQMPA